MFGINNFTNVDCEPNPFRQRGVMWNKINVPSLGPFSLELWKCESDGRLFARIGFAVQFPVFFQRICMITPENVEEVVARELRIIAKEMYNPKLGPARKRRREAPDYDPSKEYTGPPLRSTKNEPNPDIAMNTGAASHKSKRTRPDPCSTMHTMHTNTAMTGSPIEKKSSEASLCASERSVVVTVSLNIVHQAIACALSLILAI